MALHARKDLNYIIKDLLKAQESACRLSAMVNVSDEANGLMRDVLETLSRVIPALETHEVVLNKSSSVESPDLKKEIMISNKKRKAPDGSDQRSGSRRSVQETKVVLAKTIDDGQAWRKYGQKEILNSKNPRSYFRCTHKLEQGCKAQRQVQISEEDPSMFIITYMGKHTCNNSPHHPQIIQNFSCDNNSCFISFEANRSMSNNNKESSVNNMVCSPVQSIKQDSEEDVLSNLTMADLPVGGDSPMASTSQQAEDRGDVTSGLNCPFGDFGLDLILPEFDHEFDDWAAVCDFRFC